MEFWSSILYRKRGSWVSWCHIDNLWHKYFENLGSLISVLVSPLSSFPGWREGCFASWKSRLSWGDSELPVNEPHLLPLDNFLRGIKDRTRQVSVFHATFPLATPLHNEFCEVMSHEEIDENCYPCPVPGRLELIKWLSVKGRCRTVWPHEYVTERSTRWRKASHILCFLWPFSLILFMSCWY